MPTNTKIKKKLPETAIQVRPFEFGVKAIHDLGFQIPESNKLPANIQLSYGLSVDFNNDESTTSFTVNTIFIDADSGQSFMHGTVQTVFLIVDLISFQSKPGIYNFADGNLQLLFGIAFTHMRAIFAKNISGSPFSSLIVPVINPNQIYSDLINSEQGQKSLAEALTE